MKDLDFRSDGIIDIFTQEWIHTVLGLATKEVEPTAGTMQQQ